METTGPAEAVGTRSPSAADSRRFVSPPPEGRCSRPAQDKSLPDWQTDVVEQIPYSPLCKPQLEAKVFATNGPSHACHLFLFSGWVNLFWICFLRRIQRFLVSLDFSVDRCFSPCVSIYGMKQRGEGRGGAGRGGRSYTTTTSVPTKALHARAPQRDLFARPQRNTEHKGLS